MIDNIDFDQGFKDAINAKQQALQQIETEKNKVLIAVQQATQKAKLAQGDADALRATAQGQADANRLLAESLTPELIQFQALQKLADNIQIALIPSGQGLIIDPASLLGLITPTPSATPTATPSPTSTPIATETPTETPTE